MIYKEKTIDYFCKNAKMLKMCLAQVEQMQFYKNSRLLKLSKCKIYKNLICSIRANVKSQETMLAQVEQMQNLHESHLLSLSKYKIMKNNACSS